jgi:hypothetical protein
MKGTDEDVETISTADCRRQSTAPLTMRSHPHTLADIRPVDLFVAYLYDLPLLDWAQATRHAPDKSASSALSEALRGTDPRAIFETRDAVLSALQRFDSPDGRHVTRWREARRNLRPATETAALAVLTRRHLDAAAFAMLYAPFEPMIPAALLFGLEQG